MEDRVGKVDHSDGKRSRKMGLHQKQDIIFLDPNKVKSGFGACPIFRRHAPETDGPREKGTATVFIFVNI